MLDLVVVYAQRWLLLSTQRKNYLSQHTSKARSVGSKKDQYLSPIAGAGYG
jgi:hypothetical protein